MRRGWENIFLKQELKNDKIYINNMGVLFFRGATMYASYSVPSDV